MTSALLRTRRLLRLSPSRVAVGYILLGVLALALFAIPLWYAWRDNLSTFRTYVEAEQLQKVTEAFGREGAKGAAAAMDAMAGTGRGDRVMILADASKRRLAGNLPAWPAEVPDAPGTYGLVIGVGGEASMRVVASHATLPGGYRLLMGRESVRFESLVERFWYGIAGAMGIVLVLGVGAGWLIRRAFLTEVDEMSHAAKARFQGILEIAEDAILSVDAGQRIVLFNRAAEKAFGYAEHEVVGKPLAILLPGRFVQAQRRELLARRKDGSEFPAEASVSRLDLRSEVVFTVILRDITARKQAQEELQKQRTYFDELLELAPAAIVLIVLSPLKPSSVVRVNREFTRMFGYTAEEALGRSLRELIAPGELLAGYAQNADSLAAGQKMEAEVVRQRKDGSRFHAHLTASRLVLSDGTVTAYLVYRDITGTKRTQEELKRSEERYALAMEAARDGHWDWIVESDEFYASPQMLKIYGFPAGTVFAGRADFLARFPFHPEDKPKWEAAAAAHFAGKTVRFSMELRMLRQGEERWIRLNGLCLRDPSGALVRWTGSVRDVTEQKRAEAALRESEARFALAVAGAKDGIWEWDLTTDNVYYSPRCQELLGLAAEATNLREKSEWDRRIRYHPDDVAPRLAAIRDHLEGRAPHYEGEWRVIHPDGSYHWILGRGICTRDAAGRPVRFAGSTTDIDERMRTLEALKLSQERYALAMEAAGDGHSDWNVVTDEFYASPRLVEMCGLPAGTTFKGRQDWLGKFPFHPEDRPGWARAIAAHLAGETARFQMEMRYLPKGEARWVSVTGLCTRDASGKPVRWTGSLTDVTDRKRAELALRNSEERYALAMEAAGDGHSDWILETGEFYVSPRLLEICGYAPGTRFADRAEWVRRFPFHAGDRRKWETAFAAHLAGRRARFELDSRIVVRGETRWIRFTFLSSRDASGKPVRWTGSTTDITDRKRAEDALRLSEERYALAMEAAQDGHWDWIVATDEYYASPRDLQLYGLPVDTKFASRADFFARLPLVPEDREAWMCAVEELFAGTGSRLSMELRANLNGETRWIQFSGVCARDASGKPLRWSGTSRDVTDRKRAEAALREYEKQLRQAQRLEAVGTLASGIAHDFNNILGAILGYGEMALRDAPAGSRLKRDLDSVMVAGERGRALVDRILAFSRSGMAERVAVHVEPIVREVLDQLAGKLPAGVTIESKLHAGRAAVLGDPTQVHQVLMNLATNSLQAMASGGVLSVSLEAMCLDEPLPATTGLMPAGDCLVLTVADSGVGIPSQISERIFDPFFTTKEAGVGTGLGLSLVHGIVTELGGAVDVRSAPGAGSTFTVYLPRSGEAPEQQGSAQAPMPHGNRQRVLIVDDEESLVALATRTLEGLGYMAVGFTSSSAALEAFRAHPEDFDAVITDERMPGMSGSTLIREVRGIRRAIPILLASGYLGRGVAGRAYNSGADEVLKKPLLERDLAASLARVLNS